MRTRTKKGILKILLDAEYALLGIEERIEGRPAILDEGQRRMLAEVLERLAQLTNELVANDEIGE